MIERHVGDITGAVYYLAGSPAMVAAMAALLKDAGVRSENILAEEVCRILNRTALYGTARGTALTCRASRTISVNPGTGGGGDRPEPFFDHRERWLMQTDDYRGKAQWLNYGVNS